MILPGSYANGFAPRDGQPLYPELWRRCILAAAPCLGPTGTTIRDWSGYGNHGPLTGMDAGTDWVTIAGRYALDFDGTNDNILFSSPGACAVSGPQTLSLWFNARSIVVANRPQLFGIQLSAGNNAAQCAMGFNIIGSGTTSGTSRLCFIDFDGSVVSGAFTAQSFGTQLSTWFHAAGQWSGTAWRIWVNGIEETNAQGVQDAAVARPTGVMTIASQFGTARFFDGNIDDVRIYNRALSPNEIRILATRRGIAYELDPRRRSSSAVQFNRRRRLLLGASN